MRKLKLIALTLAVLCLAAACSPAQYDDAVTTLLYKKGATELYLDIRMPTKRVYRDNPVFVWFHGGGWISGNRGELATKFGELEDRLRSRGFVVVSVDYTLATDTDRAIDCVVDALDAVDFIKENAGAYDIDAGKIVVGGYSAGAQLALLACFAQEESDLAGEGDRSARPVLCVDIAGPARFSDDGIDESDAGGFASPALERYASYVLDPLAETYYDDLYLFTPTNHFDRGDRCALYIVGGDADDVVPPAHLAETYSMARSAGVDARLLSVGNMTHGMDAADATKPLGMELSRVYDMIADECENAVK